MCTEYCVFNFSMEGNFYQSKDPIIAIPLGSTSIDKKEDTHAKGGGGHVIHVEHPTS